MSKYLQVSKKAVPLHRNLNEIFGLSDILLVLRFKLRNFKALRQRQNNSFFLSVVNFHRRTAQTYNYSLGVGIRRPEA